MIDDTWYARPAHVVEERIAAGGVVVRVHAGEPLVALAREGSWVEPVLPKGGVEPGEDLEQAAGREIEEEAGLSRLSLVTKLGVLERCPGGRMRSTRKTRLFAITCAAEGRAFRCEPPSPAPPQPPARRTL